VAARHSSRADLHRPGDRVYGSVNRDLKNTRRGAPHCRSGGVDNLRRTDQKWPGGGVFPILEVPNGFCQPDHADPTHVSSFGVGGNYAVLMAVFNQSPPRRERGNLSRPALNYRHGADQYSSLLSSVIASRLTLGCDAATFPLFAQVVLGSFLDPGLTQPALLG